MLLAVILGISLLIVAIAVAVDTMLGDVPSRPKETVAKQEVKGIKAWRNLKKIEDGLNMMSKREIRIDRPRGSHRRLQAS